MGFKELANGVTGIVEHLIKEVKKNGVKRFFKGLEKGFIGLIISPFEASLKIVHFIATETNKEYNKYDIWKFKVNSNN